MTNEKLHNVLDTYDVELAHYNGIAQFNEDQYAGKSRIPSVDVKCHIRWMIHECLTRFIPPGPEHDINKAHRWLGYIQGEMRALGMYTVSELRDHSRSTPSNEPTTIKFPEPPGAVPMPTEPPRAPQHPMRDAFAMAALTGLLMRHPMGWTPSDYARNAYKMADAMIAESTRGPDAYK